MHPALDSILLDQAGVISRRQVHRAGLRPHDLARLVRRRDLTPIHPGVYVDHTGEPSFQQRCWGGVLLLAPAALAGDTAMRATEGPGRHQVDEPVHLAIGRGRRVTAPTGITVVRKDRLDEQVLWNRSPPRMRYEEAAIDVAAEAVTDFSSLGVLSRAVQSRRTTADRLLASARRRTRLTRRNWIESVLEDIAAGTASVLEHGYLTRVERAHGLAADRRQVFDRLRAGSIYRDVLYLCGVVVELDGRLFHDTTAQRDRDFDRDLDAAAGGTRTVRLSYGQVFDRPCWTAERLDRVLRLHGWSGRAVPCGPDCLLSRAA